MTLCKIHISEKVVSYLIPATTFFRIKHDKI